MMFKILTLAFLVNSIIELIQYSLKLPGGIKYFLTEYVSQDCLEAFFGQQRMRGGRNDNPSVKSFLESTSSLRIQGSQSLKPFRGNCRRRKLCTEDLIQPHFQNVGVQQTNYLMYVFT